MCGIAGVWRKNRNDEYNKLTVEAIMESIVHRGPDSSGLWASEDGNLSLGHRRLAIQDISPSGHQPMFSRTGRFIITFNGEIYNFRELAVELKKCGHLFRGHSDTEVVLACVEEWGVHEAVKKFHGMFAFAVYDTQIERLWLYRDRMGEKPLYIYFHENHLAFSSEMNSLASILTENVESDLDESELSSYFRYGYCSPEKTPLKKIIKLPPGHFIVLDANEVFHSSLNITDIASRAEEYWSIEQKYLPINPESVSDNVALSTLEGLLLDTVRNQSIADVELGVFLSGGIDSSLIASIAQSVSSTPINTFTIAFDKRAYNEAPFAREIAEHLGTNHTEIPLSLDECIESLKILPSLMDEPFADASIIPTYLVSREARKHVTVCLSGDGGDELFGGYNRYISGEKFWKLSQSMPNYLKQSISRFLALLPEKIIDILFSPIAQILLRMGKTPEKDIGSKIHKISRLLEKGAGRDVYVDLLSFWRKNPLIASKSLSYGYYENVASSFDLNFIESAMSNDQRFYLVSDNLFKVDRAAMANSLEVRLPLLDHSIVEFANTLPLNFKVRHGTSKWLLRELLYQYVPKKLIDRPKMGFSMPLNAWLKNELKSWVEEVVKDRDLLEAGNLDAAMVRQAWDQHQAGRKDNANAIWSIVCYLIWFKRYA